MTKPETGGKGNEELRSSGIKPIETEKQVCYIRAIAASNPDSLGRTRALQLYRWIAIFRRKKFSHRCFQLVVRCSQ